MKNILEQKGLIAPTGTQSSVNEIEELVSLFTWKDEAQKAFERMKNSSVDFRLIADLGGRGVIVTKQGGQSSNRNYAFTSRCFFPCAGIDEDPVTGNTFDLTWTASAFAVSSACMYYPYDSNK
jgi:hypothetical protein